MVSRLLISLLGIAAERRIIRRAIAALCAMALLIMPICAAKCSEPGCVSLTNPVVQKSDDCHGTATLSPDDSGFAHLGSIHHCLGNEQPVAAVVEAKPTQPNVGVNPLANDHASAASHSLLFSFDTRAATDTRGRSPLIGSRSTVLRI